MIAPSFRQFPSNNTKRKNSDQQDLNLYPNGNKSLTDAKDTQLEVDTGLKLLYQHKLMQQHEFVFFMTRERLEPFDLLFFITVLLLFIYACA